MNLYQNSTESNAGFFQKSSELKTEDFVTNLQNKAVSNETVEAMFWDMYAQGDEAKINQALENLESLEESTNDQELILKRKSLVVEIVDAVKNDKKVGLYKFVSALKDPNVSDKEIWDMASEISQQGDRRIMKALIKALDESSRKDLAPTLSIELSKDLDDENIN